MSEPNGYSPTSVYLYYDEYGVLLCVGITSRTTARQGEHNKRAPWWRWVERQTVQHFTTREAAMFREKELIRKHRPPFNKQHNVDYLALRSAYESFADAAVKIDDPIGLSCSLGKQIPLVRWPGDENMLRTEMPDHWPIAAGLRITPSAGVVGEDHGRLAHVTYIGQHPPFALLRLNRPVEGERFIAKVRTLESKKPVLFRIQSIRVDTAAMAAQR